MFICRQLKILRRRQHLYFSTGLSHDVQLVFLSLRFNQSCSLTLWSPQSSSQMDKCGWRGRLYPRSLPPKEQLNSLRHLKDFQVQCWVKEGFHNQPKAVKEIHTHIHTHLIRSFREPCLFQQASFGDIPCYCHCLMMSFDLCPQKNN